MPLALATDCRRHHERCFSRRQRTSCSPIKVGPQESVTNLRAKGRSMSFCKRGNGDRHATEQRSFEYPSGTSPDATEEVDTILSICFSSGSIKVHTSGQRNAL